MLIKDKIIISFLIVGILPIFMFGIFGVFFVNKIILKNYNNFYQAQLFHIDNLTNNLISDVSYDIENFTYNKIITTKNDKNFTNFLNADENTFEYNIGAEEQKIIDIFHSYLITHPYVNSVYMGRENGSFVRSHPRPRPTKYDPRERPWYKLAKENPNKVMVTEPYLSVTSDDVNIGIVKALLDEKGKFYGVVGADITLERLTNFVSNTKLLDVKYLIILDEKNRMLVHPNKKLLFKNISELKISDIDKILNLKSGFLKLKNGKEKDYIFIYSSNIRNWKFLCLVPSSKIEKYTTNLIIIIYTVIGFLAIILIIIVNFISNKLYRPLNELLNSIDNFILNIKKNIIFNPLKIKTGDELERIAKSFNIMAEEIQNIYLKLNESYEKLKENDKLKTAFISLISDELKNPILILKSSLDILKKKVKTKKIIKIIKLLDKNLEKLNKTILNLIDFANLQKGNYLFKKTKNDIIKIVDDVIIELKKELKEKKIEIIRNFNFKSLKWDCDFLGMKQVFYNLFNNAIKFSKENSEISLELKVLKGKNIEPCKKIRLNPNKKYLFFKIKDNGIGIQKKYIGKIFNEFYQKETFLRRKYYGLGIGLNIVKKIIELHNGKISVKSKGKDKGAEFCFIIPE